MGCRPITSGPFSRVNDHEPLLRNQESAGAVIQTMRNVNGGRPHTVNIDYVTLLARRTDAS